MLRTPRLIVGMRLKGARPANQWTVHRTGSILHKRHQVRCLAVTSSVCSGSSTDGNSGNSSQDYIVRSPWGTVPIPKGVTVSNLLLNRFSQAPPNKAALVDDKIGETLTYGQLGDRVRSLAASLAKHGVGRGSIVSICSPNSMEMALLLLAVPATGATVSTLNAALTQGDLERLLDQGSSDYLVTLPELLPKFTNRSGMFKKVFSIGWVDGLESVRDLVEAGSPADMPDCTDIDPTKDPALIAFSSGTTGLPKGVLLSHTNIIAAIVASSTPSTGCNLFNQEDVLVNMFPFAHIGGSVAVLMSTLYSHATVFLLNQYTFEDYMVANQKHKATVMLIPPPVGVRLFNDPVVDNYDISSIRRVISGAAPISSTVQAGIYKRLKLDSFRQGYGMTELAGVSHADDIINFKAGSAGMPLPNMMCKIMDVDSGEHLPTTATGEVWVHGPQVMLGYMNRPKDTAATKDPQGWIKTGDIGYHDEDGNLFITDRSKDLIKFKGFQVAPAELEGVLLGHPLVADAAVIGVPDDQAGEVPRAFVVLTAGASADQSTEREIIQYIADRVAPFKKLRGGVSFVEEIPKLPSGKILKRILRNTINTH